MLTFSFLQLERVRGESGGKSKETSLDNGQLLGYDRLPSKWMYIIKR